MLHLHRDEGVPEKSGERGKYHGVKTIPNDGREHSAAEKNKRYIQPSVSKGATQQADICTDRGQCAECQEENLSLAMNRNKVTREESCSGPSSNDDGRNENCPCCDQSYSFQHAGHLRRLYFKIFSQWLILKISPCEYVPLVGSKFTLINASSISKGDSSTRCSNVLGSSVSSSSGPTLHITYR